MSAAEHTASVHSVVADRTADHRFSSSAPTGRSRRTLREPINALTHLGGAIVALGATVPLVLITRGDWLDRAASAVFGLTSVLLFLASFLLHALRVDERGETWLRRFDHGAIFLLIAGTYTPILVQALRPDSPRLAWTVLLVVWTIALCGLVFKLLWIEAPRWLSTGLYLVMGWLAVGAIVPLARALGGASMAWMLAGGAFYTVGAAIYGLKRPNLRPGFGFHELWHVFVLLGWGCHAVMVYRVALAA